MVKNQSTVGLILWIAAFALVDSGSVQASVPKTETLKHDISGRQNLSFDQILKVWENQYGAEAVAPLLKIAADVKNQDQDRYVALMGAAKLSGPQGAPLLTPFLKDHSWMLRSGTLRALRALGNRAVANEVLPLLKDSALVVRSEAVEAVEALQPAGAVEALMEALGESANYHGGKAQWVPQKALTALIALKASYVAPRLQPLLLHAQDPALQKNTIQALEALTGHSLKPEAPLAEQVKAWQTELQSKT